MIGPLDKYSDSNTCSLGIEIFCNDAVDKSK